MNCPKCNAVLSANSKFCTSCGTKIEIQPEAKTEIIAPVQQNTSVCIKCGAPLKAGAKFCTKCGSSQNVQSAQPPMRSTQVPAQPAQPPVQQVPKKKKNVVLPLVIIFLVIIFLVGGYFVLDKFFGVNPIEMVMGKKEDKDKEEDKDRHTKNKDDEEDDDDEDLDGESEDADNDEDSEKEADPEVLEDLIAKIETAKTSHTEGANDDAINVGKDVLQQYIILSKEYDLGEETREHIADAYEFVSKAVIAYCKKIIPLALGQGGYTEVRNALNPVLEIAVSLEEGGIEVDSTEIQEYSDGVVQNFKDEFIKKINEITERDQWSRDEAWTYAEDAYGIQENGKIVLFDESDLDDPLRLRYAYCLSWIMRKRCENGVADGSMSGKDAFDSLISILEETDYNLLVLQDIITYGSAIGENTAGYQEAYNAIVQKIKELQNLSIVNSGVNSGTSVDVRKFWYFNDLSGEDAYKVDINNGTTQATRDWIRNNAPLYIGR